MRYILLTIILLAFTRYCYSNMASPLKRGTLSSSAISSKDIDILREKIHITVDDYFKTAFYIVEYSIKTDKGGNQIPLLFHAKDYNQDFKIWVDNIETKLLEIPVEYKMTKNTPFENFSPSFTSPYRAGESEYITIYWDSNSGFVFPLNDLKYFETNLTKGEHKIRIEYKTKVWLDTYNWVKDYTFRYSLSAAKYWKSFGALEITLDAKAFNPAITTNIPNPTIGNLDNVAIWHFSKIPSEYLEFKYTPEISLYAKAMIAISPLGLTILSAIIFCILHILSIKTYRINNPEKKYSWVVIAGSIINSFLILICYVFSFFIIDDAIGSEAGRFHGYTILAIFLYPILLPIYWLFMHYYDKSIKKKNEVF